MLVLWVQVDPEEPNDMSQGMDAMSMILHSAASDAVNAMLREWYEFVPSRDSFIYVGPKEISRYEIQRCVERAL